MKSSILNKPQNRQTDKQTKRQKKSIIYKTNKHIMRDVLKIAHRGYSDLYGDNNMLSFRKAYEEGFDVIELDIQLNRDNEIVVYHDLYKNQIFVSNMTHKQTKENDILLLKDVLEEFRYTSVIMYLDLKGHVKLSHLLIAFLVELNFPHDRIWVASINKNHLYTFICSPFKVSLGLITTNDFYPHEFEHLLSDIDFVSCNINILSRSFVENLRNIRKGIFVYTAANTFEVDYCKKFDIDGIVSNIYF